MVSATVLGVSAAAVHATAFEDCFSQGDLDRKVKGCTQVIKQKSTSPEDRVQVHYGRADDASRQEAVDLIVQAHRIVQDAIVSHERSDEATVYPRLSKFLAQSPIFVVREERPTSGGCNQQERIGRKRFPAKGNWNSIRSCAIYEGGGMYGGCGPVTVARYASNGTSLANMNVR